MATPHHQQLASAEWADPAYFAEHRAYETGTLWLGRSPLGDREPLGYSDDRHICLISGTRAGKGATTIVNNLCLWPGSVVVVDPKGENATVTAARRGDGSAYCEGMGQRVYVLDPFGASTVDEKYRSRFNPLDALDITSSSVVDDAGMLADAIVVVRETAADPYWDQTARKMIKGLILHVLTDKRFEGRRDLLTVRELIARGDHEGIAMLREAGETDIPTAQQLLWEGVSRNQAFRGVIAGIGEQMASLAVNVPKQFEGGLQTLDRNTEFLDSEDLRRTLSASDFKLSDLKTDPRGVSLYLSVPQRYMAEHFRWLRMMVTLVTTTMEEVPGQPASGHRVLMVLDEFARLESVKAIEHAVSYIAGYGLTMMFVLQDLGSLRKHYRDSWESFIANCGTKIFFTIDDHFTRKYVSDLIGETEIVREMGSYSETQGESRSNTTGESDSSTVGSTSSSTRGTSRSTTDGASRSVGHSESETRGRNKGGSKSKSSGRGGSHSEGWSPDPLFFRNTARYLPMLRENETTNYGTSTHSGVTAGTSWGKSRSRTEGENTTTGVSRSHTEGSSSSETVGESRSQSSTRSTSETAGQSHSTTEGRSETLHKRPLITPDEIGKLFDRPAGDRPAWGLVLIGGGNPAVVHRTPYFEDPFFGWLYDPHPDHEPPQLLAADVEFRLPPIDKRLHEFGMLEWYVREGDMVAQGAAVARLLLPGPGVLFDQEALQSDPNPPHWNIRFQRPDTGEWVETFSPDVREFHLNLYSPVTGTVGRRVAGHQSRLRDIDLLCTFRANNRTMLLEGRGAKDQAVQHYNEFLSLLTEGEKRGKRVIRDRREAERQAERERQRREEEARLAEERRIETLRQRRIRRSRQRIVWHRILSTTLVSLGLVTSVLPLSVIGFLIFIGESWSPMLLLSGVVISILTVRRAFLISKSRMERLERHRAKIGEGRFNQVRKHRRERYFPENYDQFLGLLGGLFPICILGAVVLSWATEWMNWKGGLLLAFSPMLGALLIVLWFSLLSVVWFIQEGEWYWAIK